MKGLPVSPESDKISSVLSPAPSAVVQLNTVLFLGQFSAKTGGFVMFGGALQEMDGVSGCS